DVLAELATVLDDVVDQPAEERDVAAGADRHVQVRNRSRAREARVDVNDGRAPPLRLHHPAEADRVALRHVRALDEDAVGVRQILLEGGGPASPERGPQTGDRRAVSYAGLVLDLNHPQRRVELLAEAVLLF